MKTYTLAARLSSVALAAALFAPAMAMAQNIAVVNGKPVPKARADALLEQAQRQAQGQGQQLPPEADRLVRDEVVRREILTQAAEKRGLTASAEYKKQMEAARQTILIKELQTDFEKKNPVSDTEIKAEYDKYRAQAGDKEYHVRHILVEKEDEAKALIAELKGGASFEEAAKKSSKDPGSAPKGGDLDWAAPGSFVPEFSQAMVKLPKGGMSDAPVKSQFGWHILKVDDVREAQFPPIEEVKPQIQQRLAQQKLQTWRDELMKQAKTDYKFQ